MEMEFGEKFEKKWNHAKKRKIEKKSY